MPTTFSVTQFKNPVIGFITGLTTPSSTYQPYYIGAYNGAQPGDPSATPAGSSVYSSYSLGPVLASAMSAAGGGISQLASPRGASASSSVGSLTFARLINSNGVGVIDTPISLSGGGGGIIADSLSSTAGVALNFTAFSIKMPKTNGGTLFLSQSLVDRLVDNLTNVNTVQPGFGINTTGGSVINVYSGAAPADADAPATGTLLFTFTIGSVNVFATAVGGSAALNGPLTSAAAAASGTASYARWVKTNGSSTFTIQGSVGTTGTDFLINTTTIVAASTYQITDATVSI